MNFHSLSIEEAINNLESHIKGLSSEEAEKRLKKFGFNILPEEKEESYIFIFIKQFKNIFNIVLGLVLVISLYLGKNNDALVVAVIMLINALLGFVFEIRTKNALTKLRALFRPMAKVFRDHELIELDAAFLVPGDIILVEEGDYLPADVRFIEVDSLKIDESTLTGESLPVEKNIDKLPEDTNIADQNNIGFMGTYTLEGKGRGIVFRTGVNTYIGTIYEKYKAIEVLSPHFQKLFRDLILKMILIAAASGLLLIYFTLRNHYTFIDSLVFILAAFVSAVPEGLPVIISVLLVLSAYNLYKKNVLVKNLQATENFSVINLLLSDKTGTLTKNVMTIRKIYADNKEIEVTGDGYDMKGDFMIADKYFDVLNNQVMKKLFEAIATLVEGEIIKDHSAIFKGNARDIALLILLEKARLKKELLLEDVTITNKEPFSRSSKLKSVTINNKGEIINYYIGAFENILHQSQKVFTSEGIVDFNNKEAILNKALEYTNKGFSVLGISFKNEGADQPVVFIGLLAFYDPPKEEVKDVLLKLKRAGIDVRILTGDHKNTAIAIAKEIGFENCNALNNEEVEQLLNHPDSINDKRIVQQMLDTYIFARITPETKMTILDFYQKLNFSVAYIGDGVNDVLCLKKADIGVSMGSRSADIAKSASDIILVDDNLTSLLSGVVEGRRIFDNLRRVVFFLITTNVAESLTIIGALFLGYPFILKPTHILFLNFVTDTLVGTSLAFEKGSGNELKLPPRNPKESIITWQLLPFLIIMASSMMVLAIYTFDSFYRITGDYNLDTARTYAFLVMSFTQLYNAINLRSLHNSSLKLSFRQNKYLLTGIILSSFLQIFVLYNERLRNFLGFDFVNIFDIVIIILMSSIVLVVGELYKYTRKKLYNRTSENK